MQCLTCNAQIAAGDAFCGSCGSKVAGQPSSSVPTQPTIASAEPTSQPSKSGRKRTGVVVGVIVALLIVGAAAFAFTPLGLLFQDENPLYDYTPEDASFFVGVDLLAAKGAWNDGRVQGLFEEMQNLAEDTLGESLDIADLEDELWSEIGIDSRRVSIEDQVLPWVGRWATAWLIADTRNGYVDEVDGCFTIQVRDRGEAQTALDDVIEEFDEVDGFIDDFSIDGVEVSKIAAAFDFWYIGLHEQAMLICSSENAFEDSLDAFENGDNLGNNPDFSALRSETPSRKLGEFYANAEDATLEGFDVNDSGLPLVHYGSIQLTDDGVQADYVTTNTLAGQLPSAGPGAADFLPEMSFFAANTSDLGQSLDGALDALSDAYGENRAAVEEEIEYRVDFDPFDWIASMEGTAGIALTTQGDFFGERIDFGVIAFSEVSDARESERVLNLFERDFRVDKDSFGDIEVTTFTDGGELAVGVSPDRVYIATSPENIELADSSPLSSSSRFKSTLNMLPGGSDWLAYFDTDLAIDAIEDAINAIGYLSNEEENVLEDLFSIARRYIPSAVMGFDSNDDIARLSMVVELADGR